MGAISTLINAGAKQFKKANAKHYKEEIAYARKRLAAIRGNKGSAGEATRLQDKITKFKQFILEETPKGGSSTSPRTTFGGKKRSMAAKSDKPVKRTVKSTAVKKDFASKKGKLKASTVTDKESNTAGEKLVKAGLNKFDKTLTADDLFKGEKVPRKVPKNNKDVKEGIEERARATKRKQRYKGKKE